MGAEGTGEAAGGGGQARRLGIDRGVGGGQRQDLLGEIGGDWMTGARRTGTRLLA